jgi:hypothetical protein
VLQPSGWAMMLIGFAGIAFMTYHRRKFATIAASSKPHRETQTAFVFF